MSLGTPTRGARAAVPHAAVVSGCKIVPPVRPVPPKKPVYASLCGCAFAVRRLFGSCRATPPATACGMGDTSVATAAASACGGKASRPIHRWGRVAGERRVRGLGLLGAPRPARPALSAKGSADRPARRASPCTRRCGGRLRVRTFSTRRARAGRSRCSRRHSGTRLARRTSRRGRARRSPKSLDPQEYVSTPSPQA